MANDKVGAMSELIVRPSHNDHRLVEALLAPTNGVRQMRPPINRLVLDAQVAAKQPAFARAAEASGTPVLIDPLTFFLQDDVREDDPWRRLPFSRATGLTPGELEDEDLQAGLISGVVQFEIEHGATAIIGPYLLLGDDPRLLRVALDLISGTRAYMDANQIELPLVPILAVLAARHAGGVTLRDALGMLADRAIKSGASSIALAMSGTGGLDDGPERVHLVLQATQYLVTHGLDVIAWRQGLLGPSAVAVGASGYECGIGTRERCDLVSLQRSRRPGPARQGFAPPAGVFIQPLGRSFARPVARALLEDQKLRARLVCDFEQCCPEGIESMLTNPRPHAVNARSRHLASLDRMPSREWKLNAVAREAENAAVLADLASRILHDGGRRETISSRALGAIAVATDLMREEGGRAAS
jgi:hypothetical protein